MNEAAIIPDYFAHITYAGVFIWFFFLDQWMPIPEEVILTYLGYLIGHGFLQWYLALPIAVLGLALADNSFFWLAKSGGFMFKRLSRQMKSRRFRNYQKKMENDLFKTLLTVTFIPKLRFFGPILAALTGVRWRLFAILDLTVLLIYTATYLFLGFFFYGTFILIFKNLSQWHHAGFFVTLALIGLAINLLAKRKTK